MQFAQVQLVIHIITAGESISNFQIADFGLSR